MTELLCAVGVVPTRVYPKSGRISALAGREGRLRACTPEPKATPLTATTKSSYNIRHSKAMVFPGLRPGAAALFSGGEGAHMLLKRQRSPVVGGEVSAVF